MSHSVLVVAAHPDDEVLGAGGTLARHGNNGDEVRVIFLADGVGAGGTLSQEELTTRKGSARMAADLLGLASLHFLDRPDNRLDTVPLLDIVQEIEARMEEVRPATVYTHHGGDLNVDHRIAHQATLTACRPLPGASIKAIYAFEVPSSSEWSSPQIGGAFEPRRLVEIDIDLKLQALNCYDQELRKFPHPRSAEAVAALARWRGASAGLEAAEAFDVVREII